MTIDLAKKLPNLTELKISRSVLVSGILSFLYVVEICIGFRTVYFLFTAWVTPQGQILNSISWVPWLGGLALALSSTITINTISAIWEKRQLEQEEEPRNIPRFAFHVLVGGILWRYVSLWWSEKKDLQKKGALMLTILKFLFTQIFTIPMVIIHVCFLESLEEMSFVMASVMCIAISVVLTCVIFSWCGTEVEDLPTLKFENLNLVPILFRQDEPTQTKIENPQEVVDLAANQQQKEHSTEQIQEGILTFLVWLQTLGFTFGRLLALGILLKLAGIYAITIMVLQFLASVIYLKFQNPLVVSDTLTNRKQLTRLAFLSYTLIFEWHLHRSHKTGYNFSANVKHGVYYYCITISESIFYIVAWVILSSGVTNTSFDSHSEERITFISNVAIIGCLSLIFSLFIHICLILWKSERLKVFCNSMKRNLEIRNLGNSLRKTETQTKRRTISDISRPYLFVGDVRNTNAEMASEKTLHASNLERQSSYRDLKEPIDEEIEIYVRRNESSDGARKGIVVSELNGKPCEEVTPSWINVTLTEDAKLQTAANPGNTIEAVKSHNIFVSGVQRLKASLSRSTYLKETQTDTIKENSVQQTVNDASENETKCDSRDSKQSSSESIERNEKGKKNVIVDFSNGVIKRFGRLVEMSRSISSDLHLRNPKTNQAEKDISVPDKSLSPPPELSQKDEISTSEFKDCEHVAYSESYKNIATCTGSSCELTVGDNDYCKNDQVKLQSDPHIKIEKLRPSIDENDHIYEWSEAKGDKEVYLPYKKPEVDHDISTYEVSHFNVNNLHNGESNTEKAEHDYGIKIKGSFNSTEELDDKDYSGDDQDNEAGADNDSRVEIESDDKNELNDSDELVWDENELSNDNTDDHDGSSCPCHTCRFHRISFRVSGKDGKDEGQGMSCPATNEGVTYDENTEVIDGIDEDKSCITKPALTPRKLKDNALTWSTFKQNVEHYV